jgi:hypothetical protein
MGIGFKAFSGSCNLAVPAKANRAGEAGSFYR